MSNTNNTNNENEYGGRSCIQFLILGAFGWGALMMYPKTVDLLSNFAPDEFMGYTEMAGWWAMGSALLIEGVMTIMKLKMWLYPARNLIEWAWDAVLSILPFVVSALCQVFDSMITRDTLSQQPAEVQLFVTWGVPALPAFIIGLMVLYGLIESAPKGLFGSFQMSGGKITLPSFKLPDWLNRWFGGNGHDRRKNQPQKPPQEEKRVDPTPAGNRK